MGKLRQPPSLPTQKRISFISYEKASGHKKNADDHTSEQLVW
jgi:hypothetical protein